MFFLSHDDRVAAQAKHWTKQLPPFRAFYLAAAFVSAS
jgi:hypothetical protein